MQIEVQAFLANSIAGSYRRTFFMQAFGQNIRLQAFLAKLCPNLFYYILAVAATNNLYIFDAKQ